MYENVAKQRKLRAEYLARVRTAQSVEMSEAQAATLNFYEHPDAVEIAVERAVVCECGQLRRAEGPRLPAGNAAQHRCYCGNYTAPAQRSLRLPDGDFDHEWDEEAAAAVISALTESWAFYGPAYDEGHLEEAC